MTSLHRHDHGSLISELVSPILGSKPLGIKIFALNEKPGDKPVIFVRAEGGRGSSRGYEATVNVLSAEIIKGDLKPSILSAVDDWLELRRDALLKMLNDSPTIVHQLDGTLSY